MAKMHDDLETAQQRLKKAVDALAQARKDTRHRISYVTLARILTNQALLRLDTRIAEAVYDE